MIDNFEQIKGLLKFDTEEDFYFLQVIQRKKDHKTPSEFTKVGSNNSSRLIKAYYIYSVESLDKYKHEIVELCKLFGARAGISLNRRNNRVIALEMLAHLATNIKNNHFGAVAALYNTVCGQHHSDKDKVWILDVDHQNNREINEMINYIDRNTLPEGNKFISMIPSKSGYHVITKPFDPREFGTLYPEVEIHKNNPTNLYIP